MESLRSQVAVGLAVAGIGFGGPEAALANDHESAANRDAQAQAMGEQAGPMAVAAARREGRNGNNLVCGGVQTKQELIRLAKGGADECGNTDIDEAWARFGITPELTKTAKSGVICGDEGMTSQGRRHSPNPHIDKLRKLIDDDGSSSHIFERPLSVWGKQVCYDAWVMHLENGRKVGVIKDCGNGEGRRVPKKTLKQPKALIDVVKVFEDASGNELSEQPTGVAQFLIKCKQNGRNLVRKVIYNRTPQVLAACDVGKNGKKNVVSVEELETLGEGKWKVWGTKLQRQVVKLVKIRGKRERGNRFGFKNQQVVETPPPVVPPCEQSPRPKDCDTPPPPPPPVEEQPVSRSCSLFSFLGKDGRTVNLRLSNEDGGRETLNWGDGSVETTNTSEDDEVQHFYKEDETFTVNFNEKFPDGSEANCSTTVTTDAEGSAPPPPPPPARVFNSEISANRIN